jgi:UDP-N-acetyl-D-glucosamine dehydrogenase
MQKEKLIEKIKNKDAVIGVVGLGYVGVPLAKAFMDRGYNVIGVDINPERVKKAPLVATADFSALHVTDCIIICVPTPLTKNKEPDLSHILSVTKELAKVVDVGKLIVLESTTYPGTTEEVLLPEIQSFFNAEVGEDFFVAYSPERTNPGDEYYGVENTPKVVSGITDNCLDIAWTLYNEITERAPIRASSTRTAEMAKILENTFRCINIALVNELKVLATDMGIDINEVIDITATKPFGYVPFQPGPGLGGHCVPIDPFYLSWKAREYNVPTRFIELAGEINRAMPMYVVERTIEALNDVHKCLRGSSVLVLGVAYKKDIDDDRESPGYEIMDLLEKKGANVFYNDPYIPQSRNGKYGSVILTPSVLGSMDAVIIATDHSEYDYGKIVMVSKLVIDTRNATKGIREGRGWVVTA